jgi:NAD(P)-dependent dehydrogenase (short-subunit alcohol dehydrogenase family)
MHWFITGASRGLGRAFAAAALERGDRVAATARRIVDLGDLVADFGERILPLQLDVTDRDADFAAVTRAHEHFGRLDVVVNNAGYGHVGAFEELTAEELRNQLEVNLFGTVWVTQAALPFLRNQGSGHIVQISSIGGVVSFPHLSAYHASKWALEGMTESLAIEVKRFGIKTTLVEPGAFDTDSEGSSARHSVPMPEYDFLRAATAEPYNGETPGDPHAAARALLQIVDAEKPPQRVLFGPTAHGLAIRMYERRLELWRDWAWLSQNFSG